MPIENYLVHISNPENGLSHSIQKGAFNYTAQFIPKPLVKLRNQESGHEAQSASSNLRDSYEGMEFYQIRISSQYNSEFLKVGIQNEAEYFERVAYYTTYANSDIWLVSNSDSIPCATYHFERNYGLSPYNTMLLGFKVGDLSISNRKLIFIDQVLGQGKIVFPFNMSDLKNIPSIKL